MMIPKRNHKPVMLTECYRYIRYLPTKNEKYCRHLNHLNGGGLKLWDVQRQLANLRIWLMWYTNLTRHIRNSSFRVFCAYFLKHTLWRSLAIKHGWFWIPRGLYNALNHHSSFVECTISISKGPEFWWSVIDVQYSVWSTPIWFFDVDGWNPMLLVYSFLPIGAIQTAIFPLGSPLPGMAVATFQVRASQEAAAHPWGDPWQGKSQKIVQVAGGLCLYVQHFAIQISCVCVCQCACVCMICMQPQPICFCWGFDVAILGCPAWIHQILGQRLGVSLGFPVANIKVLLVVHVPWFPMLIP